MKIEIGIEKRTGKMSYLSVLSCILYELLNRTEVCFRKAEGQDGLTKSTRLIFLATVRWNLWTGPSTYSDSD